MKLWTLQLVLPYIAVGSFSGTVRGGEQGPATVDETAVSSSEADSRSFEFHYRFDVTGLEPGKSVRVWMPVPESSDHQRVRALTSRLPARPSFHRESEYGNRILYLEVMAPTNGELSFDVPYRIRRQEVAGLRAAERDAAGLRLPPRHRELFLRANTKVPIDGRPLELLADVDLRGDTRAVSRQLYDLVDRHVSYDKAGTGWGQGDVLWVCESRYGNCTDFHSLFISLARSQGIPARFEIGFPIPRHAERGAVAGYHCWAFFFEQTQGWVPVDISEADKDPSLQEYYFGNLTPDRVAFSSGRDIQLVPESASGPLNYFVYPHVEVDGTVLPREQVEFRFSYAERAAQ